MYNPIYIYCLLDSRRESMTIHSKVPNWAIDIVIAYAESKNINPSLVSCALEQGTSAHEDSEYAEVNILTPPTIYGAYRAVKSPLALLNLWSQEKFTVPAS